MKQFTREDLVAFMYNETSSLLSAAITKASKKDEEIRKELNSLMQVKDQLTEISHQPMQVSVDKIMLYAKLSCCPN